MSELRVGILRRFAAGLGMLALAAGLAFLPSNPAQAYVDPNTVGPLYQFLFPLLVAVASTFAALRRQIGRLWKRLTVAALGAVRGKQARSQSERHT